ncbi:SlyX family protein [Orrella sp. NBD-18]|uniref:SlyX family protein n=1 Tax=Sheuella amnicola TaxID=2707330 RepID=A0A6B2R0M0_9BURK|nr:SlyX family protein [Sheuella amnicola]NDY84300.1 SlyX family protein [Sheuella amnicola]
MNQDSQTEKRLTELEIKLGLADDLLDQLNQAVFRQQRQIEALSREIIALRQFIPEERSTQQPSLRDELPPHY